MTHALHMTGLTIRHSGVTVLRDIDLHVRPGESLCLIGASGSGKSLIAAAIMGMLPSCMAATGSIGLGGPRCCRQPRNCACRRRDGPGSAARLPELGWRASGLTRRLGANCPPPCPAAWPSACWPRWRCKAQRG